MPYPCHASRAARMSSSRLRTNCSRCFRSFADPDVVQEALVGSIPRAAVSRIALMTDGASRLVDVFGRATWRGALDVLDTVGPTGLIDQVRQLEVDDPEGRRWPRYKTSDDASVVYMRLLR